MSALLTFQESIATEAHNLRNIMSASDLFQQLLEKLPVREENDMGTSYDDRDGKIWMDGQLTQLAGSSAQPA